MYRNCQYHECFSYFGRVTAGMGGLQLGFLVYGQGRFDPVYGRAPSSLSLFVRVFLFISQFVCAFSASVALYLSIPLPLRPEPFGRVYHCGTSDNSQI